MATTNKWVTPEAIASALTTELNTLTNGTISSASAAIDNLTDLYQFMELEIALASLNPTGTPYLNVYLIKQIDGTNYEDSSASATHQIVASTPVATGSATKRAIVAMIPIPPCAFKLALQNQTNVSLASSGNTLKYRRFNSQAV